MRYRRIKNSLSYRKVKVALARAYGLLLTWRGDSCEVSLGDTWPRTSESDLAKPSNAQHGPCNLMRPVPIILKRKRMHAHRARAQRRLINTYMCNAILINVIALERVFETH